MTNTIYVFANMGNLDELPKSGGQSSARRVMKGLQNSGFAIIPICRHRAELEGRWKHLLEITVFAFFDLLKIIFKILLRRRKNVAFLQLTYAGPLVPYELLITLVVKFLGYKSIIYLKGGQVLDYYAHGSRLHRWMFKKTMNLQEKVFFEGMESLKLVKEISTTPLVYFPNYIFDEQIPSKMPEKPKDTIGMLYFGRIAPNKNIDIILDTFEQLCKHYENLHLTLIGGIGQSKVYAERIDRRITESPYSSKISRIGITSFDKIKDVMQTQHFFLFPTKEKAEGHSNSLNEAMSQGLIPIVSDYHFNRSIVGDDRLVVNDYDATLYADKIIRIIKQDVFVELSNAMWKRIKEHYAFSIVNNIISKEMSNI